MAMDEKWLLANRQLLNAGVSKMFVALNEKGKFPLTEKTLQMLKEIAGIVAQTQDRKSAAAGDKDE